LVMTRSSIRFALLEALSRSSGNEDQR
jgi:hypothetical protein